MPVVLDKEMDQRIKISATNPSCSMDRKKIYERAFVIVEAIFINFLFTLFTFRMHLCRVYVLLLLVWYGVPYALPTVHSSCYSINIMLYFHIDKFT